MITGRFGNKGELFFEIELVTGNGFNLPVEAMLDTGFTEFLAINKQDLDSLNWIYFDEEELQTAQGSASFDIYLGQVIFNGQSFDIPVFAGDDIQEILLGSEWLKIFDLTVKYKQNILTLE